MRHLFSLLTLCVLLLVTASAVSAGQLAWNSKEFMGVDEIRPGMIGYGKTVFEGTKVATFNIQVIGVLKKLDFGFDMILIKVTSGPVLDRKLQTVEGMSGSPIYINNRLIGAYAYGWNFEQEPVAGVTPIAAMLECTEPGSASRPVTGSLQPSGKVLRIGTHLISRVKVAESTLAARQLQSHADPSTMVLCPVATPLFVSGVTDAAMQPLQAFFSRYNLRAVPGPGSMPGPAAKLEPGSAVAVSLVQGDTDMSAVGTVTYVKGDTVLAFGHPFLGMGKLNLPMSTAYVQGILSSAEASFKLASPVAQVGTISSDRQFAIGGTLGSKAAMVPVTLHLTDAARKLNKEYHVRLVDDPIFTPYLLYSAVLYNGASHLADVTAAQGIYQAHATFATANAGEVEQDVILPQLGQFPPAAQDARRSPPMAEFLQLADLMMVNPYESVKITSAKITVNFQSDLDVGSIEKITPDRNVARPGDTINLAVRIRPFGKPAETRNVAITVPKYAVDPMMLVLVAGGGESAALKQLLTPLPTPEEGIKGIIRFLTKGPAAQSLFTAQLFPTPSYVYRGNTLKEMPLSYAELLGFGDTVGTQGSGDDGESSGNGNDSGESSTSGNLRPTTYQFSEPVPYSLYGGQIIPIAIDLPDRKGPMTQDSHVKIEGPVLSMSLLPGGGAPEGGAPDPSSEARYPWRTSQSSSLLARLFDPLRVNPYGHAAPFALPVWRLATSHWPRPLSSLLQGGSGGEIDNAKNPSPDKNPGAGAAPAKPAPAADASSDDEDSDDETPAADADPPSPPGPGGPGGDAALLTRTRPVWGISGRKDFLRGTHLGTTVTSEGSLVLMPGVQTVFETTDFLPSKLVATKQGAYVGGWKSNEVIRLADDGKSETVFPKKDDDAADAECVTGLAADADGNLLVATWPDQHVRLVSPDGAVRRTWTIPGTVIWDLAVTSSGKRYAAADQGALYVLKDDQQTPLQVACNVPDKSVFVLAAAPAGDLYLATSPRGKVYRLSADGLLSAVYESKDAVSSLAADAQGNVYVGTSPSCTVVRVSPDGTSTRIMTGYGTGNHHVMSMKVVESALYATTGPAGGIYCIDQPAGQTPAITTIFSRNDMPAGKEAEKTYGPESVMVNAIAVDPQGAILVAASSPGQVLKLMPRRQGAFISAVLPSPSVSKWGQMDVYRSFSPDANPPADAGAGVTVEVRSGRTAWPDATWSQWSPLKVGELIDSPPALYAQIRATLTDTSTVHTALDAVRLHYQPANRAPQLRLMEPATGVAWHGKKDVRWEGKDPDGDTLIYTVFVSPDNGKTWGQIVTNVPDDNAAPSGPPPPPPAIGPATAKPATDDTKKSKASQGRGAKHEATTAASAPVQPPAPPAAPPQPPMKEKRETTEMTFPWNTATSTDGTYLLKVVASDKYARPLDARSVEVFSGPLIIDNTAPTVTLKESAGSWDEVKSFTITDNLTPIIGGKFRLDGGQWIAIVPDDGFFDSVRESVSLLLPDGPPQLADGEHKLEIYTSDSAGNPLNKTVKLVIGKAAPVAPAAPAVGAPAAAPK